MVFSAWVEFLFIKLVHRHEYKVFRMPRKEREPIGKHFSFFSVQGKKYLPPLTNIRYNYPFIGYFGL